jgi:hypothetical protein
METPVLIQSFAPNRWGAVNAAAFRWILEQVAASRARYDIKYKG